jgi:NAD(P)-dependent dehydrogenase (short-subunit alcohol dehydrogenase family)
MTRKSIVITGASSGIGKASAHYLAGKGFRVFAGVRKTADAESLLREYSGVVEPIILDVTDENSRCLALEKVGAEVGDAGLYGLVNNAGVSFSCPLEFVDQAHLEHQINTNFIGPVLTTRAFLPLIRKARGRVINVSSGAGQLAIPLMGTYSASKFALEGMSDALRVELRQWGIHVSVIVPGATATPILEKNTSDFRGLKETLPSEAWELYGEAIETYSQNFANMNKRAEPADVVARTIEKALNDRKPKSRYPAGRDSKTYAAIKRFLTDRMKDSIVGRMTAL